MFWNNNKSVKVSNYFDFYRCYANKNGHQNRLKIGNWPFWSKIERLDIEINIEHKQIPKIYRQTKVKHHPNIISETFFVYKFLQKNNQFVIFYYPSLLLVCWKYQNVIWSFCWISTVSCIHQPLFFRCSLKKCHSFTQIAYFELK